jgi:dipeptidyl aminopeptidase/acylaminoacyl peptidase
MSRLAFSTIFAALALAAVPASSPATFIPGPNGKITFASGRASAGIPTPDPEDKNARIWVADYPAGIPVQVTSEPTGSEVQHRHPSWSPDHTRIVYAAGKAFVGPFALWIVDLRTGSHTEFAPAAARQDRPSWSPDGTEIAYGSGGDLWVKGVAPGAQPVQLTNTLGIVEERPVWSPDGDTLYFNRGNLAGGAVEQRDIYSLAPVVPEATQRPIVTTPAVEEWQPALSPDGKKLCYLRGPPSDGADLYTVGVDGSNPTPFADQMGKGELNCVWSPDGTRILYTRGVFKEGELGSRDLVGGGFEELAPMNVADHFDGNADWATNFSPSCDNLTAEVAVNGFTRIALSCKDPDAGAGAAPPTPTPLEPGDLELRSTPSHGTLGTLTNGAVVYTPNKDFKGTDAFTYTGSDGVSNAAPGRVTIDVSPARDTAAPSIADVKLSRKRWRRGNEPGISPTPIGTVISFRLSEDARVTLAFKRKKAGKRAGSISVAGKAGINQVRFRGRLTRKRFLAPGRYRLVLSARDAAGNQSKPRVGPTFTIVPELGAL